MRLVTFSRKNEERVGLVGPQDQIIDLAEMNKRYLRSGNGSILASMQAFIDAGGKAITLARQAEKYVLSKNAVDQKKLAGAGALVKLSQVKLLAPIPRPRKNCVMLGVNYREHVSNRRASEIVNEGPTQSCLFTGFGPRSFEITDR